MEDSIFVAYINFESCCHFHVKVKITIWWRPLGKKLNQTTCRLMGLPQCFFQHNNTLCAATFRNLSSLHKNLCDTTLCIYLLANNLSTLNWLSYESFSNFFRALSLRLINHSFNPRKAIRRGRSPRFFLLVSILDTLLSGQLPSYPPLCSNRICLRCSDFI